MPDPTHLRRRAVLTAALLASTLLAALTGCSASRPDVRLTPSAPAVEAALPYWTGSGTTLRLDACNPTDDSTDHPAVVILHGGGFTSGTRDEAGSRAICTALAGSGVAAFSIDYRLLPAVYPAQVEDLQHAIEWLRKPSQVARFRIDPKRIGLLGSSAGAIVAQEAAVSGSGAPSTGTRVSAVVSLSGVSLMTAAGLKLGTASPEAEKLVLAYLGCSSRTPATCAAASAASSLLHVDSSTPPMLLVNGSRELVPAQQASAMASGLRIAKVPVETVTVPGSDHGLALLNGDVRSAIQDFYKKHL